MRRRPRRPTHGKGLLRSILNPQIILLTIAYLFVAYGVYAIVFFLPLIVKGLGLSNLNVGYVTALPNLFGTVGMILVSRSSDRSGERLWHVVVPTVIAGVAMILAALSLGNAYLAMAAFCLAGFGIASCLPVFWNLPTAYLGAATAAGGIAFINSVGNVSGYVAPQFMGLLRDRTGTLRGADRGGRSDHARRGGADPRLGHSQARSARRAAAGARHAIALSA